MNGGEMRLTFGISIGRGCKTGRRIRFLTHRSMDIPVRARLTSIQRLRS